MWSGDYVIVQVDGVHASTLRARAVEKTSLTQAEARIAQLQQQQQQEEEEKEEAQQQAL